MTKKRAGPCPDVATGKAGRLEGDMDLDSLSLDELPGRLWDALEWAAAGLALVVLLLALLAARERA